MLLTFSVSGFRSFADEAVLDLVSPSLRTNIPRAGEKWEDHLESLAAIYGPNASGKTTLLDAMWALATALRNPGSAVIFQPCAVRPEEDPVTEYGIEFIANKVRYRYEVTAHEWGIGREVLYSFPRGSQRRLFRRTQAGPVDSIEFTKGSSLSGPSAEVLKITQPGALYLATAAKYGHQTLTPIAQSLMARGGIEKVSFRDSQDRDVIIRVVKEMVGAPNEQTALVAALLQAGDLGIEGIRIQSEEIPQDVYLKIKRSVEAFHNGTDDFSDDDIPRLLERISFIHHGANEATFELPLGCESSGTLTWLTIAWHALNALRNGGVLLVDELDASLHPGLARYIVELFSSAEMNVGGAQLIFTTHDVSLLGNAPTRILEPRNVWFVEKSSAGASELFSLADFDSRPGNNSERRYLAGQFGAVPDMNDVLLYDFIMKPREGKSVA